MVRSIPTLATFIVISGCAVTTLDGDRLPLRSDEFAVYVEQVFRRQNEIATRLTIELDSAEPDSRRAEALEAAELELLIACADLNELAGAQRDGGEAGGLSALRQARRTPDCERAAEAAADLL